MRWMCILPAATDFKLLPLSFRSFTLLLFITTLSVLGAAQQGTKPLQRRKPALSANKPITTTQKTSPALLELAARGGALEAAQQSGDPAGITNASRHVAALALQQLAEMKLARGAALEAAESYRRSIDFEDVPAARVGLANSYLVSGLFDECMSQLSNVLVNDPQNAQAWRLQGQLWMAKTNYQQALDSFNKSSTLQSDAYTSYLLGTALLRLKQPDKAKLAFGDLLQRSGSPSVVRALSSDAYRSTGYIADADRALKRALAQDSKLARAHYRAGMLSLARNEWTITPLAQAEFSREVQQAAHDFFANYALGLVEFFEQHYEKSENHLRAASAAQPEWPEPWLYLGIAAYSSCDKKLAEEHLRKAIELTGTNEGRGAYQIRRAYYTLGRLLQEEGRNDEAADTMRHLRQIQTRLLLQAEPSTMTGGMAQMGAMAAAFSSISDLENEELLRASIAANTFPYGAAGFVRLPRQLDATKEREQELRKILSSALNDLGTVEARQEQFTLAVTHFHEAEHWYANTPGLMRNLGMAAARIEEYQECVRALRPVIAANPQDKVARSMLGLALFTTNAYAEAVEVFTPLGESALERPELAYSWAASLVRVNRYPEATALLDKLEARPLPPETLILVAQTWSQMGNFPRTVDTCHKALEADPKLLRAHYIAGLALIRQDRPADAASELRAELDLDPDNVDVQFHLAFALLQQSQNEEAVRWLRSVLARSPEHPEANYELGKELLSAGKAADAIPYLEAAARLRPAFEPVHYQLQSAYRSIGRKEDADREAKTYRELKAKSRNITLPPPREAGTEITKHP